MAVVGNYREVLQYSRHALQVERYHTWPTVKRQTVGEHTAQVLRIYVEVFGGVSGQTATAILKHDMGELATGDLPSYVKVNAPEVKPIFERLEVQAVEEMGFAPSDLDQEEAARVKVCDTLEALEFAVDEMRFGSEFGVYIWENMLTVLKTRVDVLFSDWEREKVWVYYIRLAKRRPRWAK